MPRTLNIVLILFFATVFLLAASPAPPEYECYTQAHYQSFLLSNDHDPKEVGFDMTCTSGSPNICYNGICDESQLDDNFSRLCECGVS